MKIKLTAFQQPVFREPLENLECTLDMIEANKDTDWILTPECAVSGYCQPPVLYQPVTVQVQHVELAITKMSMNIQYSNIHVDITFS